MQLAAAGDDVLAALLGGADHQGVRLGPRRSTTAFHGVTAVGAGCLGDGGGYGIWGSPKKKTMAWGDLEG